MTLWGITMIILGFMLGVVIGLLAYNEPIYPDDKVNEKYIH